MSFRQDKNWTYQPKQRLPKIPSDVAPSVSQWEATRFTLPNGRLIKPVRMGTLWGVALADGKGGDIPQAVSQRYTSLSDMRRHLKAQGAVEAPTDAPRSIAGGTSGLP